VVLVSVIGSGVGTSFRDQSAPGPGESGRADKALNDAFKKSEDETVLVQSKRLRADDPRGRRGPEPEPAGA
jgi:hypothetical protein